MGKALAIVFASIIVCACGAGSGRGLDNNGTPISGGGDTDPPANPGPPDGGSDAVSLQTIQDEIFTPECSSCHSGGSAPRGLRLDSVANAFNLLVNVAADEVPDLLRVNPGNPDISYLVRKLEGGPDIVGAQMPLGGTPISAERIAMVRSWISDGANAPAAAASTKVTATTVKDSLDNIVFEVDFNRIMDGERLEKSAISVYLHDDSTQRLAEEEDLVLESNNHRLRVQYLGEIYDASSIELVLNAASGAALYDINGAQIDGNKNDSEGGEYRYVYSF